MTTTGPRRPAGPVDGRPADHKEPCVHGARPQVRTIDELHFRLGEAVRRRAPNVDVADVEAAVAAAAAACVDMSAGVGPVTVAGQIGDVLAAMTEDLALPVSAWAAADWSPFGALIPVLSGSPGAGASVFAAAVTDALAGGGRPVLLVDAADPARSGLAGATVSEGALVATPHQYLRIRYSWRERALLARLESPLPVITPGMVPPPPAWLPELKAPHVTVVDIGHDGWRATANPLAGAGGWLRRGDPPSRPVLVVRPTRPSLRHAEQILARLDGWVAAGVAVAPHQLVVMGAKRWPAQVVGAAGRHLAPLIDQALFIPHDTDVALSGVTTGPCSSKLLDAVTPLLQGWGLLPPGGRPRSRRGAR